MKTDVILLTRSSSAGTAVVGFVINGKQVNCPADPTIEIESTTPYYSTVRLTMFADTLTMVDEKLYTPPTKTEQADADT